MYELICNILYWGLFAFFGICFLIVLFSKHPDDYDTDSDDSGYY